MTEWNATSYHKVSAPQTSWGQKVLNRLHVAGDERATALGDQLVNGRHCALSIRPNFVLAKDAANQNGARQTLNGSAAPLNAADHQP